MIVKYGVKNPTLVNLIMVLILVSGVVVYQLMPRDLIPMFRTDAISVETFYAGASAEEIDKLITSKIEEAVESLEGVDETMGTSMEGRSRVVVSTKSSLSDDEVYNLLDEIRTRTDMIRSELPEDAGDPEASIVKPNIPVINVAVYGELPELKLKEYAENLERELERIEGVNDVTLTGAREREVWVEISPVALEKYGLTISTVRAKVAAAQVDLAAGTLKTDIGEFLVRTKGEKEEPWRLSQIVVASDPYGGEVLLSDIADIRDTFTDALSIGRFNGEPALLLLVSKNVDGDSIDISDGVFSTINDFRAKIPPSVDIGTFWDTSTMVETRLHVMLTQGAQALILVLATLCIFLTLRMAFFTSLGIPISFLGGLVLLFAIGYTMNMIAMFAFIIVLGLVVDDAIVVTENCFRIMERGVKPRVAAIIGTRQMIWPVTAAIATTVAAFIPLMLMSGVMGEFLRVIPVTVTFVLLVSLFECLVILPSHIADWTPKEYGEKLARRKREHGGGIFSRFIGVYERGLRLALNWRYVFLTAAAVLLVLSLGYAFYKIPTQFMREFESDQFIVSFECPTTYKLEDTLGVAREVEEVILSLPEQELKGVSTTVGVFSTDPYSMRIESNICQFFCDLAPLSERRRNAAIYEDVRKGMKDIQGIVTFKVESLRSNPGGAAITVYISGDELQQLRALAATAKEFLRKQSGTRDIQDDFTLGKREVIISLNDRGKLLGFDNFTIATQLRAIYSGTEAARIRPPGDDFPIYVKYDQTLREHRDSIDKMWLTTPSGETVRLVDIANILEVSGLRTLKRRNGDRTITVSADVNSSEGNANMIMGALVETLEEEILANYPGYEVTMGGQTQEFNESLESLGYAAGLSVLLILLILTALFRSIAKTLIILAPIPLCMVGVVVGHVVQGMDFAILSFFGVIALTGVVVNDSILVMDFINTARKEGMSPFEAAVQAGRMRMRPVILTTITTICGLSSLAFFASGQTEFLSPMAVSVVWGIAFATVITLVVVPALYMVYIDIRRLIRKDDESEMKEIDAEKEIREFHEKEGLVREK